MRTLISILCFGLAFSAQVAVADDQVRSSRDVTIQAGSSGSSGTVEGSSFYWTEVRSPYDHHAVPERYSHKGSNGVVSLHCVDGTLLGAMCFGGYYDQDQGKVVTTSQLLRLDESSIQCRDQEPNNAGDYFSIMAICTEGRVQPTFP